MLACGQRVQRGLLKVRGRIRVNEAPVGRAGATSSLASVPDRVKVSDDLLRLAITHNSTLPILKSFVAYAQKMITALDPFEEQPAVLTALADSHVVDENPRLGRSRVDRKSRNRQSSTARRGMDPDRLRVDRFTKLGDQHFHRGRTFVLFFLQCVKYSFLDVEGHRDAKFGESRGGIADMLFHDRRDGRALERHVTGKHLIQHHAQTVDV